MGEDTGTPVIEDYADRMPFRFSGRLVKFTIDLGASKLTAAEQRQLEQLWLAAEQARE